MNLSGFNAATFDGPAYVPAPALGPPPGVSLLLNRRRRSLARALPPDLLAALVAYLRGAPTLLPVLSTGFGAGGFGQGGAGGDVRVYDEVADAQAVTPFVVVSGYAETLPGETAGEQPVDVDLVIRTDGLDQARAVGRLVKDAVDSPNMSPTAVGRPRLAFDGGTEAYLLRDNSKPERLSGVAKGGVYAYAEVVAYRFFVDPEQ